MAWIDNHRGEIHNGCPKTHLLLWKTSLLSLQFKLLSYFVLSQAPVLLVVVLVLVVDNVLLRRRFDDIGKKKDPIILCCILSTCCTVHFDIAKVFELLRTDWVILALWNNACPTIAVLQVLELGDIWLESIYDMPTHTNAHVVTDDQLLVFRAISYGQRLTMVTARWLCDEA